MLRDYSFAAKYVCVAFCLKFVSIYIWKDRLLSTSSIAVGIFREMQNSSCIELNHVTHGAFLKTCLNLLYEDRLWKNSLNKAPVHQYIQGSQMGDIVLRQLADIDPPEFKIKLLR